MLTIKFPKLLLIPILKLFDEGERKLRHASCAGDPIWARCSSGNLSFRALAVRRLFLVGAPSTGGDALKIAIGGLIALAVIGYVASQWKKFD